MASRCKFYVNHRKSERASLCTGGCGHRFPAPGGRCHHSSGIPPALDSEIFNIMGAGGAARRFLGRGRWGLSGCCSAQMSWGGSSRPWHSPSLHQEGVPPDPHLLFQVKPGGKKHTSISSSMWGAHVSLCPPRGRDGAQSQP